MWRGNKNARIEKIDAGIALAYCEMIKSA